MNDGSAPTRPKPAEPARTLVLGLGNDILTDDAVGLCVAEMLEQRLKHRPHITVMRTAEMGLALLDLVVGFQRLVLIDAIQTGQAPPGFLHEIEGLSTVPVVSPHFLGVGETLALGRKLGLDVPSKVRIFAVEAQDPFTVGTGLTAPLQQALPEIVSRVEANL